MRHDLHPFPDSGMSYDRNSAFCESVGAAVTPPFYEAAVKAALTKGLTLADFVRISLSNQMARDGVEHPKLPVLKRTTFRHLDQTMTGSRA